MTRHTERTLSQAIYFRQTAVKYADAVCQSAHKTLNAMNGSSYLHINGDLIDRKRLEKSLYMFQSSSPSYVIASSADIARDELTDGAMWEKTYDMCKSFKEKNHRYRYQSS